MQTQVGLRQYLTLFLLFGATGLLLGFTVDVSISDEAGVRTELPSHLGDSWTGHEVLSCHNRRCTRSWLVKDLTPNDDGSYTCPKDYRGNPCGGKLHTMAYGEMQALPSDTVITKKRYFHNQLPDQTVFASIILSGNDRSSIHRPEVCMTGQDYTIDLQQVIDVPLPDREPLQVMVLNMSRTIPGGPTQHSYYAYWFVGKDVETPHHIERMLWMGRDRIFRNVSHRWAYIAISGERPPDLENTSHHNQIRDVVSSLYPQISLIPPQPQS